MASTDQVPKFPSLNISAQKYISENEANWGDVICCPKGPNTYRKGLEEVLEWPEFLKDEFRVCLYSEMRGRPANLREYIYC